MPCALRSCKMVCDARRILGFAVPWSLLRALEFPVTSAEIRCYLGSAGPWRLGRRPLATGIIRWAGSIIFPKKSLLSAETGNFGSETGSPLTASATTQSSETRNLQLASRNAVLRPFLARGGLRFPVSAQRHRLQVLFSAPVSGGKNPVPNSTRQESAGGSWHEV